MRRRPVLLAAPLLVAAALLAGCGGGSDGGDEAGTTTTEAPTTTGPAETTASSEPPPTGPSQPTAYTVEARDAVNELKAAWEAGDPDRARAIAPGDVVDALFLVPSGGFEVYGCDTGEFPTSTCNFRNRGSGAFIVVSAARSDQGWQITTIDINGD